MSAPRLVATDLDGTLVRSDNTVSAYTQQVLAELDERDAVDAFEDVVITRRWLELVIENFSDEQLDIRRHTISKTAG